MVSHSKPKVGVSKTWHLPHFECGVFNVQSDPFVPLFLCTGWGVWHMLLDTVAVYCTLRLIGGTLLSVVITWLITMVRCERSIYIYSGTPL